MSQPTRGPIDPAAPVVASRTPTLRSLGSRGLIAVIAGSVAVGIVLSFGALRLQEWQRQQAFAERQLQLSLVNRSADAGDRVRLGDVTLHGPRASLTLPPGRPMIVNVWLQGCQDCMPAFEAWRDFRSRIDAGFPLANVAYGRADDAWAARYRADEQLVFDEGSAIVKPLGIGSFTTLVIDGDGTVVFRDRPDGPAFFDRMLGAIAALSGRPRTSLTEAELLAPLRAGATELKACLALAPDPGRLALGGPILHTFVRPDGTAAGARLDPFVGEGVERCVGETLRLMRWPPFSGERRELVVPLALTPDSSDPGR
jgi:hypothetical protein